MPDVMRAFREILQQRDCRDEKLLYRLESAGLVARADRKAVAACPLYQEFFAGRIEA
jgi:hypothetical protein